MSFLFFFFSLSLTLAFSDIFLLAVQLNAIQNLSELKISIIIIIRRGGRVPFSREKEKKKTYKVRRKKSRARTSRSNTNGNSILPTNQRTRRNRKFIRLSITPIRTTRHTTTIDSSRSSRNSATPAIDNHRRAARSKRKSSSNTQCRSSELTRRESERDGLRAIDALENCHGHVCERGAADGVSQRSP